MSRPEAAPAAGRRLLMVVALLYAAEGFPFGLVNDLVPVWLKVKGTSLQDLGLVTLVGLPWSFKALWAPLVDRFGTAAAWIAGALAAVGVGTALMPWVARGTGLGGPLVVTLVAVAVASATQDVAIDGYTATVVPPELHGRVNGVRVATYRIAMLVAGGGAVAMAGWVPWPGVFLGLGALAVAGALFATRLVSVPRSPQPIRAWFAELREWFLREGLLSGLGLVSFVLLFKLGDAAMGPMVKPFWLDAGLSVQEVGFVSITLGTILSMAGAVVGGEIATRFGLFRSLWTLGLVQALSNLGYAAAALWPSRGAVYGASVVENFTGGLGTAAFLALLMRLTEGEQAATRFAVLTALAGLTRTLAGAISGLGAEHWGYSLWFAFTFLLALPAFGLLPVVKRRVGE